MPQLVHESVYSSWTPVTASDTTAVTCRALFVTGAGTLVLRQSGSAVDITVTAVASEIYPFSLSEGTVRAASTATGIFALN